MGKKNTVCNGENRFNQVYLGDVLDAYYLSYIKDEANGKSFNICSSDNVKVKDMIQYGKEKFHSNSMVFYFPVKLVQTILKIMKRLGVYVIHPGDLEWMDRDIVFDNTKAKNILGFKPTKTTRECLEILVDSFLKMDNDILKRNPDRPFV